MVSIDRARDFVHQHGVLWERALFAQLFEGGRRERTLRCLALHQNEDGGWGHGLEHDVRTPASNAPTAENVLGVVLEFGLADPEMLRRTAAWCGAHQREDGTFELGEEFHAYPRAGWWQGARHWPPSAIAGRLAALGAAPPRLLERSARWVAASAPPPPGTWPLAGLTREELERLGGEEWRYALYHYLDYFRNVETPGAAGWRDAVVTKALALAEGDPGPDGPLGFGVGCAGLPADALPAALLERHLDAVASTQAEDGGWPDPHGLLQWRPIRTIWALKRLREHGR